MGPKMEKLKYWLITHGTEIREIRKIHKENQRSRNDNRLSCKLYGASRDYRHYHIAYSELRGVIRERIEKPRKDNLPNEEWIKQIKEKYLDGQQTLCVSS